MRSLFGLPRCQDITAKQESSCQPNPVRFFLKDTQGDTDNRKFLHGVRCEFQDGFFHIRLTPHRYPLSGPLSMPEPSACRNSSSLSSFQFSNWTPANRCARRLVQFVQFVQYEKQQGMPGRGTAALPSCRGVSSRPLDGLYRCLKIDLNRQFYGFIRKKYQQKYQQK